MKRREFIAATATLLVSPRVLRAQGTHRRIGCFGILENAPIILDAWRSGLRERGWIEGKNLLVEYRYTQPTVRYPALAAELTALSPDLVVAAGPQAAVASFLLLQPHETERPGA
jgi:putative tryptophan/tyrosine transport system substrate-binding protein